MSDYLGVVTTVGQQKLAASIGGTPLSLTTVRVGDGNGAAITPTPGMTDLVRRVGTGYPVSSSGRDPANLQAWRITAQIPETEGPFDIREIGVFDAAGDMIAIARHVLVEKRTAAQGAAVGLVTDIVFPVSDTAQVSVAIQPAASIDLAQMLRQPFLVVESATVTSPPANPAPGRTHVVPAGATSAWSGYAGYLAMWNGTVWAMANPPLGHLVVVGDVDIGAPGRFLRHVQGGWANATASELAYGVTRFATPAEHLAGLLDGKATHPAGVMAMIAETALLQSDIAQAFGDRVAATLIVGNRIAEWNEPGTSSWTVPAGVTTIIREVWGAGGSGGGYLAWGGCGGGRAWKVSIVEPGDVFPVVVGEGGAPSTSSGHTGGTTSIGTVSASGGGGGNGTGAGLPGAGSGGDINETPQFGGGAPYPVGNGYFASGSGGAAPSGGGVTPVNVTSNGSDGAVPGGGSAGASVSGGSSGTGAHGRARIYY